MTICKLCIEDTLHFPGSYLEPSSLTGELGVLSFGSCSDSTSCLTVAISLPMAESLFSYLQSEISLEL